MSETSELMNGELALRILEASPDAVLLADRDGIIRFWNPAAERIFGYSPAEALGASLDLIIPESLRERHWTGYRRVLASGTSRYHDDLLAVPALHRDGRRLSCEFSIVIITNADNEITGFASIMRDVTARWEREKALRAELAQREREKD
jgi:PAS domain S-box-containing protein